MWKILFWYTILNVLMFTVVITPDVKLHRGHKYDKLSLVN